MPKKCNKKDIKGVAIHPRSRKASQLQRVSKRTHKIQANKLKRNRNLIWPLLDRVTWFQMALDPEVGRCSTQEVHKMIKEYISRHNGLVEELQKAQRKDRPIPKRLDELLMVIKEETDEYEGAGMQIPDLTCVAGISLLRSWDGTRESFDLLSLKRFRK